MTSNSQLPANMFPRDVPNKSKRSMRRGKKAISKAVDHDDFPSRGSKNHFAGKCRPCLDFGSGFGCNAGALCNFCHFPHAEGKFQEAAHFSESKNIRRTYHDEQDMQEEHGCAIDRHQVDFLSRQASKNSCMQFAPDTSSYDLPDLFQIDSRRCSKHTNCIQVDDKPQSLFSAVPSYMDDEVPSCFQTHPNYMDDKPNGGLSAHPTYMGDRLDDRFSAVPNYMGDNSQRRFSATVGNVDDKLQKRFPCAAVPEYMEDNQESLFSAPHNYVCDKPQRRFSAVPGYTCERLQTRRSAAPGYLDDRLQQCFQGPPTPSRMNDNFQSYFSAPSTSAAQTEDKSLNCFSAHPTPNYGDDKLQINFSKYPNYMDDHFDFATVVSSMMRQISEENPSPVVASSQQGPLLVPLPSMGAFDPDTFAEFLKRNQPEQYDD